MKRSPRPSEIALRADYLDYLESLAARAEHETNGVLWSRAGAARRDVGELVQWDLFARPWHWVARYASEELREFFDMSGRMTFTEYRADIRAYRREEYESYLESLAA